MAEQQAPQEQQPTSLAATFPNPPPFWQDFTPENLKRVSELRAAQSGSEEKTFDPSKSLPIRLFELPPELRYLQPPEPPADGRYRCFGDVWTLNDELPTLEGMGIQQLYTPPTTPGNSPDTTHFDRALILKRLAKSLLLNFLELVGVMGINPAQYEEKIEDLRTLFINFHHLLNEYRPHQARESLILMMRDQLERSRAETKGIMDMKKEVEGILDGLGRTGLVDENEGLEDDDIGDPEEDDARDVWEELEKQFG